MVDRVTCVLLGALLAAVVPAAATATAVAVTAAAAPASGSLHATPIDPDDAESRLARLTPIQMDEVIWLARCIYSESDRPHEQELVAWVVRNRVETEYRGRTYREVVLEARQFSAFNAPTKRRAHILSLTPGSPLRSWQRTLEIALDVYEAPPSSRPFAQTVRHFYSPVSMVGGREPHWADGGTPLSSEQLGVDERRFIFFDDVDPQYAGTGGTTPSVESSSPLRSDAEGHGLSLKLPRPSGKVSRPRRPSIVPPRGERRF